MSAFSTIFLMRQGTSQTHINKLKMADSLLADIMADIKNLGPLIWLTVYNNLITMAQTW